MKQYRDFSRLRRIYPQVQFVFDRYRKSIENGKYLGRPFNINHLRNLLSTIEIHRPQVVLSLDRRVFILKLVTYFI